MYTVMWLKNNKLNVKDMQVSDINEAYKIAKGESVNFEGCIEVLSCGVVGLIVRYKKGKQVFP